MLNQINSLFHKKHIAPQLKANEDTYDQYFGVLLGKYTENKGSHKFFKDVFEKLMNLSDIKKIFEERLLALSDTLSNSLKTSADLLQKISFTLSQSRKVESQILNELYCMQDVEVDLTYKKLISGMDFWANFFLGWSADITEDMTEFFRYKKHEQMDLSKLLKERVQETYETEQRIQLLENKKRQLF